jgi:hypothetical protein
MDEFPAFNVRRADEDPRPGLIDAQMINDLLTAELVIADLSFLNPNAFYEIGIRHMAQKPIIHMQLAHEKIPFDLSLYRAVKFSRLQYHEFEAAKVDLRKAVSAVLAEGYQVENPVTNARGRVQLNEHATPAIKLLTDEMETLRKRVGAAEASASIAYDNANRALGISPGGVELAGILRALGRPPSTLTLTAPSDAIQVGASPLTTLSANMPATTLSGTTGLALGGAGILGTNQTKPSESTEKKSEAPKRGTRK